MQELPSNKADDVPQNNENRIGDRGIDLVENLSTVVANASNIVVSDNFLIPNEKNISMRPMLKAR